MVELPQNAREATGARPQAHSGRDAARLLLVAMIACSFVASTKSVEAQTGNPSSTNNAFYGSVTARPVTDDVLQLSLDEAVRRGLETNLGLKEAEQQVRYVHGEELEAVQQFLPTVTLKGDTGIYQHDLAAQGFGPGVLSKFRLVFP